MTNTTSHIAAACVALLLTLATFQQAIAVPGQHPAGFAVAELA